MSFCATPTSVEAQRKDASTTYLLEIEQLKQVIRLLGSEIKTLRSQQTKPEPHLAAECEKLKKQIQRLELENKKLVEQCDGFKTQLKNTPSQNIILQPENSQQIATLACQLSKTQEELLSLISEKATLLSAKKENEEALWKTTHENKLLQEQLKSYSQKEELLQKERSQYLEKTEQTQQKLLSLEKELFSEKTVLSTLQKEYSTLEEKLATILKEKNSYEKEILELKKELETTVNQKNEAQETIQELEERGSQLFEEKENVERRCKETDELLVMKLRAIAEGEEEIQNLSSTIEMVQTQNKELLASKEEVQQRLSQTEKQTKTTLDQLQTISKELESYKHKLAATTHKMEYLENWKRKIEPSLIQLKTALETPPVPKQEEKIYKEPIYEMTEDTSFSSFRPETRPLRHDSLF